MASREVQGESVPRQIYEGAGVKFRDGKATLTVSQGCAIQTIELDENFLLEPQPEIWQEFRVELGRELGAQVEVFDVSEVFDMSDQLQFTPDRRHHIFNQRIWHHDEYVGVPPRLRRYYTYLKLEGDLAMPDDAWQQIIQYVVCVIATVGMLVVLTLIPGGQVVIANFIALAAMANASCLVLVSGVGSQARNQALLSTFVRR